MSLRPQVPCTTPFENRRGARRSLKVIGLLGLHPLWALPLLLTTTPGRPADLPAKSADLADEVSLLYSSQLPFSANGIPLVTIGLMEEQQTIAIRSEGGLRISGRMAVAGAWVEREVVSKPGARFRLEVIEATPAKVAYWCGVESLPYERRPELEAALARFRERGETTQVFEVGSVFGIRGHVIDNRTFIVGVRAFSTEAEADRESQALFAKYGERTFVHAHMTERPSGRIRLQAEGLPPEEVLDLVRFRPAGDEPITVERVEHDRDYPTHGFEDRRYTGEILVTIDQGGALVAINRIEVDRLLEGLVPSEIFTDAPMDALEAQAVVARGEVFAKIGTRHFLDPYRLCAATHCQVYAGVTAEQPRTSRAVQATQGELLFFGSNLVDSVYSACCGGHTEDNDSVWEHPRSLALRGKPDMDPVSARTWQDVSGRIAHWLESDPPSYCRLSSFGRKELSRWRKVLRSSELDRLVALVKPIGQVVSIQVLDRGVSGRVKAVRVVGSEGDLIVQREWPVRKLFGLLKSGMFEVEPLLDAEQMVIGFEFKGGGWGHGVGMCQIGACGMAEQGHDYREILSHYYNGAKVFRLYGGQDASPPGVTEGATSAKPASRLSEARPRSSPAPRPE